MIRRDRLTILITALILSVAISSFPKSSVSSCSSFSLFILGPFCAAEKLQHNNSCLSEFPEMVIPKMATCLASVSTIVEPPHLLPPARLASYFIWYDRVVAPTIPPPLQRFAAIPILIASRDA